jgi:hypothetical protein
MNKSKLNIYLIMFLVGIIYLFLVGTLSFYSANIFLLFNYSIFHFLTIDID